MLSPSQIEPTHIAHFPTPQIAHSNPFAACPAISSRTFRAEKRFRFAAALASGWRRVRTDRVAPRSRSAVHYMLLGLNGLGSAI